MLYVLSGMPYREVLTFKDVSKLPSPCVINSSTLELAQNKQLTKLGGYVSDSLMSTYLNDDGSTGNTFSTSTDLIYSAGTRIPHVVYYFDARQEVQNLGRRIFKTTEDRDYRLR